VRRIGADVGGTFTDLVACDDDGRLSFAKVLSTPPAYDRAVTAAVQSVGGADEVVHGTTVATNAVLERRGAHTAVVTTAGFRDVLELRRMRMPHLYDYFWSKPAPLVERQLRFEVRERVLADGTVRTPLDDGSVREIAARLRDAGVESVAVCLLHAHLYPAHEQRVGEILREELPRVPVSLSSEILREQQEYERTATTVVNAYVRPLMGRYVADLQAGLGGAALTIMQSAGGVMSVADAAERPVYALESGPAAGVVAARALAQSLGHANAIAFDMGGTTAKASLIENGHVSRSQEYEVGAALSAASRLLRGAGELIRIPTIDIAEVGAGGGSVAWLDDAGALNVGPRSAGASPGPACYGLGGTEATVTDANVALGYIPEGRLADGEIEVSRARAEEALASLGVSALGVHDLANATMMRALRAVSTEKGRDPADFVLIAYGGSGPVHAAALAAELGVRTAIVPPLAGLFSATGLLHARAEWHDVRFCKLDARAPDLAELRRLDAELSREGVEWHRSADVRYRGQSWSITVDFPGEIDAQGVAALVERFEAAYAQQYGTTPGESAPVDIRALRLVAFGPERAAVHVPPAASRGGEVRRADFGNGLVEVPVRTRQSLVEPADGPLLVDEYDTTVVVPPGWTVRLDAGGALVLVDAGAQTRARAHDDSVTIRIVGNALATLADEMATTVFRTAHSAVVRDAMDFSAALCAPTGETIAQAVTIPLQLGSIPNAMSSLLRKFGGAFAPGDVYLVNDPFDGASHTPDLFVVRPSFAGEELLGFAVTVAHHNDVGGRVPGTIACDSTEVFQEGLRLPWLKLVDRGEPVECVYEILRANVRMPHELLGDLGSQVAACALGARGLAELSARYPRLGVLMDGLLDHTERLLRAEIATWPDGVAEFTDYIGSDGIDVCDVPVTVRLEVKGDEIVADFSDSAPMVRGSLNCTRSFVEAAVYHVVMAASEREIPQTGGALRPITVVTKPGTVVHVVMPNASSMRGVAGYRISDVMNGALAQIVPDRVPAAGEGGSTLAWFSGRVDGEPFVYNELVVGTWGGRPVGDGNDGLANPCASIANVPVEVAEADWPIVVERYGLVPDSGGDGRFRGGLAVERVWRCVVPDTVLHVRSDRQVHRPYGLAGGLPGAPSSNVVIRADGTRESLPPMFAVVLQPGDLFAHRMAGGGGWGDPVERDPAARARDVANEKVSA
jgi:N-methylhydantoinase A/oxoprolinase/acetone carboxylase beta subunit/N-methylhydantoinase B/oxoprolinase/acetone carboxylase alpha subunit